MLDGIRFTRTAKTQRFSSAVVHCRFDMVSKIFLSDHLLLPNPI
jgi:hypothetical protein